MSTMDIHSPKGTKVKFVYPDAGYDPSKKRAKEHLTVGKVYTVSYTIPHGWNTDVFLEEVPGIKFNSSMFDRVGKKKIWVKT